MNNPNDSPILLLPPEIFSHIFALCVESTRTSEFRKKNNPRLPPLALAAVCQAWKEIAHNTPYLWSTCWLAYAYSDFNSIWLRRTGGTMLLDIYGTYDTKLEEDLFSNNSSYTGKKFSLNRLLDAISPFIPRFRVFNIHHELFYENEKITYSQFDAPNMIESEFLGYPAPHHISTSLPWFYPMLSCIPNIRHLHLFVVGEDLPIDLDISLSNLTHLHINHIHNGAQLRYFLNNAPRLCSLRIGLVFKDGTDQVFEHRSLQHLEVFYRSGEWLSIALDHLSLPSLETLRLGSDGGEFAPLIRLLTRSGCKLVEFEAVGREVKPFMSLFQHEGISSSLQTLRLPEVNLECEFFDFLSKTTNLPQLRVLSGGSANTKSLCKMLRARRRLDERGQSVENACLESIELDSLTYHSSREDEPSRVSSIAEQSGIVLRVDGFDPGLA